MPRRRLLNPRCTYTQSSGAASARMATAGPSPCGSTNGNRRLAACAGTAHRGGRDVTASTITKSSAPPPPPPSHLHFSSRLPSAVSNSATGPAAAAGIPPSGGAFGRRRQWLRRLAVHLARPRAIYQLRLQERVPGRARGFREKANKEKTLVHHNKDQIAVVIDVLRSALWRGDRRTRRRLASATFCSI